MKKLLFIVFLFSFLLIEAQSYMKNEIKAGVGVGVNDRNTFSNFIKFGYNRHISHGVFLAAYFLKAHGGAKITNLIERSQVEKIIRLWNNGPDEIYGQFIQFQTFCLSLKKNVRLNEKYNFAFDIGGIYSKTNRTRLINIEYDTNGDINVEKVQETYSSRADFGMSGTLSLNYMVRSYLAFSFFGSYQTKPMFITVGIGATALF